MNITVIGAGNVGTQIAVHAAEKGHSVIIFNSKPEKVSKTLTIVNENDEIIHRGSIQKATSITEEALFEAEVVFVVVPAMFMYKTAKKIENFVRPGMKICLVPGTGGGECAFRKCIEKGAILFGIQRVPSVARLVEYGKCVKAIGYRDEMFVGSIPAVYGADCSKIIEDLFDIKCSELPNYLNITLTPSNPILHTTRLRCLFKDYKEGVFYDKVPLFYEEWDDETSELLFQCDMEVQNICSALSMFDLSYVKSLRIHYESDTVHALTNKIRSIRGFKGLTSPAIKTENGYVPDFSSRYFTADFSYGLSILIQIAKYLSVKVPYMESVWEWYRSVVCNNDMFEFTDYKIDSIEDFLCYYSR